GAAALETQRELADRDRLAHGAAHERQHLTHAPHAVGDRGARAAELLNRSQLTERTFREAVALEQLAALIYFTAQAEHEHAAQVGMARIAGQRALKNIQALARVHAAAGAVRERGHAVDARKIRERG